MSATPERPDVETDVETDPDADPGQLNPRDLRDVPSGDGVREDEGDTDGDPEELNPRDS